MTARDPTALKAAFENGDTPQGSDFSDLIDSFINVTTSADQAINSNLETTGELAAASVSAASMATSVLNVTGTAAFANANYSGRVIAAELRVTSTAEFSKVNVSGAGVFDGAVTFNSAATFTTSPVINSLEASISAGGNNQATATTAAGTFFSIVRAGTSAQGISLPTFAVTGQRKAVYNAVTANEVKIYPPTSAQINNLGLNNPFVLSADRAVQFFYEKNSRIWITGAF